MQNGTPTIKKRELALCIILTIITCGIYAYVWLYNLTEDVKNLSGDAAAPSGGTVILLSIVTCGIYSLVWLYKQGERIDAVKSANGMPSSNSGILYLVLGIIGLGIVSYALMQNEINSFAS